MVRKYKCICIFDEKTIDNMCIYYYSISYKKKFGYASVHLDKSVELQQMKIIVLYGLKYVDHNSSINDSGT